MAWPLSSPSDSFTSPHKVAHPDRPRSSKKSSLASKPVPSPTLLSLLAILASTLPTDASPTPPTFLCPSLGSGISPNIRNSKRAASPIKDSQHDDDDPLPEPIKRSWVPDKYVKGSDGVWRKAESYTLYGATVASNCNGRQCRSPPQTKSAAGDNLTIPNITYGTTFNSSTYDFQLPPGWNPVQKPYEGRTTVILAVTLALSLFICFFILSCLFWRNRKKSSDVEAKAKQTSCERLTLEERRQIEQAKALKRFWARATARWKSNARQSLRQRTGRRLITRPSQTTYHSTSDVDSRCRFNSRPSSRFSSISNHNQPLREEYPQSITTPRSLSRPASPPAYHYERQIPPIVISSASRSATPVSGFVVPDLTLSGRPSQSSMCPSTTSPQLSPESEFLSQTAHVATDDKALLSRLAELASAPPDDAGPVSAVSPSQVSAPAWSEEFEAFTPTSAPIGMDTELPLSSFPSPPSKARLAAAERFEYTFAYDDIENAEPEPEPSAPPFEEEPERVLDASLLLPSAPPLIVHGDQLVDPANSQVASAQAWEDALPLPFAHEHPSGQNHDRNSTATSTT